MLGLRHCGRAAVKMLKWALEWVEVEHSAWEHDDIIACFVHVQYVFKSGHIQGGGKQIAKEDCQTIYHLQILQYKW